MAKKYCRPLLTFYLSKPPAKGERGTDFRTLGYDRSEANEALLDALLRDVQARQSLVRAALEDEDEADPLPFVGSIRPSENHTIVISSIVETLAFSLEDFRAQASTGDAFGYARAKAEEAGVFVLLIGNLGSHHSKIGLSTFRGYALADSVAPFIVINDDDSHAAWSFTLFHELVHVWLGEEL